MSNTRTDDAHVRRARKAHVCASLVRVFCALIAPAVLHAQDRWTPARPGYEWHFPGDHWAHPAYRTEWWYFTGQLTDEADSTRTFGYQFTFFRVGVALAPPETGSDWATQMLVMGHAAIGDFRAGSHTFSEILYRAVPMLGGFGAPGDSLLAWSRGPTGTRDRWTLRWTDSSFAFAMADDRQGTGLELNAVPERPVLLQGPGGLSRKGPSEGAASLYYSFTRLATSGTLRTGGRTYRVRGRSWMDKEFGSNQLERHQVGWDWFSLQLDDGRDLMVYMLRDSAGTLDYAHATLARPGQPPMYLERGQFEVRALAHWTSPVSRARYPARWQIIVPAANIDIEVQPVMEDQENRSAFMTRMFYWEGAVVVRGNGRRIGQGYVELVGYGNGMRPAL